MQPSELYQYFTPFSDYSFEWEEFLEIKQGSLEYEMIHEIGRKTRDFLMNIGPSLTKKEIDSVIIITIRRWKDLIGVPRLKRDKKVKKVSPLQKYVKRFSASGEEDMDLSRFDEFTEDTIVGYRLRRCAKIACEFMNSHEEVLPQDELDHLIMIMVENWDLLCFG